MNHIHWRSEPLPRASLPSLFDLSAWQRRTLCLIAAITLVRLVVIWSTGLSDTEAYYFAWSRHLDLSYYDHPPLVAWMTWLTTLVSTSAFAVRVGAVASSAAFLLLLARLVTRVASPRAAFFAVAFVVAIPAYAFTSFLANPEAPLAPLWVLALLQLWDLESRDEPWRPIALGATIGAAFLAKYTAVLLVPVALVFLASSARGRRWFTRPSLWAGALVALVVTTPVLAWNVEHGWPSLTLHLSERMSPPGAFVHNAARVGLGQLFLFHPLFVPAMLAMVGVAIVRARDPRFRLLAAASAPVLAFFFFVMARASDAEPHWTMVGWLPALVTLAIVVDERVDSSRALRWYVRAALGVSAVFLALYVVHVRSTTLLELVPDGVYQPSADPFNETIGWDKLTAAVRSAKNDLGPDLAVASDHNVLCGHIEHATGERVYCASPRRTEYDFIARRDPPRDAPVLYVDTARYAEDPSQMLGRRCEPRETIDRVRAGRVMDRFRVFVCAPEPEVLRSARSLTLQP